MQRTLLIGIGLSAWILQLVYGADPAPSVSGKPPVTTSAAPQPSASTQSNSLPPTADTNETVMDPIVVTATRTPEPLSKSTASITVISRDQIEDNQYQTVADALEQVPGLHLATSGTAGQFTGVFLRGTEARHTQIAVDGRLIPPDMAGAFDLTNLSTDNVESIEVLRGPSSSLYGGSTIGGVINIITRDGRGLGKPETEISSEAGSFNTFHETISSRGAAGPFDYSAGLSRLDSTFQQPNNDYRASHADAKLGYQWNSDLYSDVTTDYRVTNTQDPNSSVADQNASPTDSILEEVWRVSPGLTWQTNDIWKQNIYYMHYQERQVALGNVPTPPAAYLPPYPQFPSTGSNGRTQINGDSVDYQSDVQVFEPWLLTAGASMTNNITSVIYDQANDGVTPPGQIYHNSQTNTAGFLQSQWDILKNWKWTQAVRLERFSEFGDEVTWRSGTSYQLECSQTNFHASYGTAFTPPAGQDYLSYGGLQVPNFNLKPERSRGYDAGITQPLWEDRVNLSATYFHNHINNYIGSTDFDNIYSLANYLSVVTSGEELGAEYKICEQLSTDLSYTYTNAEDQSTGIRLVRRPRQVVDLSFVSHPIKDVVLTLGGSVNMQAQDYSAYTGSQIRVPDYYVARATAAWDINQNWQIFGRIENLTNSKYQEIPGYPALDQAFYGGFKFSF